jgi:hypothetical protein
MERPRPPGGSRKGKPNKVTADVKTMILGALSDAGGQDYLARQALEKPVAFLALLGRVMPLQLTGKDGNAIAIDVEHVIRYRLPDNGRT